MLINVMVQGLGGSNQVLIEISMDTISTELFCGELKDRYAADFLNFYGCQDIQQFERDKL